MVAAQDLQFQLLLAGIGNRTGRFFRDAVRFPEGNPPFQKQTQTGPHGVGAGLHDDEVTFWDGLEFIRSHERPLHHLDCLARVAFPFADVPAHDGAAAQRLGQHLGGLGVRGEAAENRILHIVLNNLRSFTAIVFFQLREGLDDWDQGQFSGSSRREQGQNIKSGHGAQLITEEDHPVFQLPTVLVRHSEQLTGERLNHEAGHKVLAGILLREYEKDGGLLRGKILGVDGAVEAEDLLEL